MYEQRHRHLLIPRRRTVFPVIFGVLSYLITSIAALSPLAPASTAQAAIPKIINFQGKLTNAADGTNVTNGTYAFEFKLYSTLSGGSPLWTETFDQAPVDPCQKLQVTNGVFNAKLGSCNPLTGIDFTTGSLFLSINFAPTGTSYDGEMSPRKQLLASAYAFNAENLVGGGLINITNTASNQATINYDGSNKLQVGVSSAGLSTFTATGSSAAFLFSGGNLGVGGSATAKLQATATTEQLRLAYDGSNYVPFTVSSGGNLTVAPTGGTLNVTGIQTISSILQVGSATATTYSRLGTGTTGHSLDASNDLLISDDLEVDDDAWIDGDLTVTGTCTGCGSSTLQQAYDSTSGNTITTTSARNIAFTFAANTSLVLDAATTDTTQTNGVIDLDVDSLTNNASAMDINFEGTGTTSSATQNGINLVMVPSNATNARTYNGIKITNPDSGSVANTIYGLNVDVTTANSNDTTYAAIFQGGNVGIGTTTPEAALHVSGGSIALDNNQQIRFKDTSGNLRTVLRVDNADNLFLGRGGLGALQIAPGGDVQFFDGPVVNQNGQISVNGSGFFGRLNQLVWTTAGNVGIGAASPDGRLEIAGNATAAAWGLNGIALQGTAATYTDSSSSGTVTNAVANSFGTPTFAASSSTIYTNAANLYVSAAPSAGSNVTITNGYALWVDAGVTRLDGNLQTNVTGSTQCLHVDTNGVVSGTGADCGSGGGGQTPWTSNIDADGFALQDALNIEFRTAAGSAPAGSVIALYADNSGDLTANVLTGKTLNVAVNGTDEYNFSSTALAMNSNNVTGLGTNLTAAAGLTVGTGSNGTITLDPNGTGNIVATLDSTTTGNLQVTKTATTGGSISEAMVAMNRTLTTGGAHTLSGTLLQLTSNNSLGGGGSDTGIVLGVTQSLATASGVLVNLSGAGTGNLLTADATNASANGMSIDIQSSSSSQYALSVTSNNGGTQGLYVRADGKVGVGTANPAATLEALNGSAPQLRLTATDNTEYTELQNSSAVGLTFSGSDFTSIAGEDIAYNFERTFDVDSGTGDLTATPVFLDLQPTFNFNQDVSGGGDPVNTSGYTGIRLNVNDISGAVGSGAKMLMDLQVASASLFSVDNAGNTLVAGNMGLQGGSIDPDIGANMIHTYSGGDDNILHVGYKASITATDTSKIFAGQFLANSSTSSGLPEHPVLIGSQNQALFTGSGRIDVAEGVEGVVNSSGSGLVSDAYGSFNQIINSSSSQINRAWGSYASMFNLSSNPIVSASVFHGEIDNIGSGAGYGTVYGVDLSGWSKGSGSVTTSYGIYMDNSIDIGTTKYALYSSSASDSYLAGNLGIGVTAPGSLLQVQQVADSTVTASPVAFDINSVGSAGELTASSGTQTFARIAPVINQSSTAAYTGLLFNATETAVGSGAKKFADFQVGGTSKISLNHGAVTTSGASAIAGIFTDLTLTNSAASGFQYGNRSINTINGSTAGTEVGQFIRMIDNTTLDTGQVVRGLEVQAFSGTNVNGTNTGIASFGYTFGLQGTTTAQAAAQAQPAAVFADLDNGTDATTKARGNAIRAYTDNATSADMVNIYQETSAYTGNLLLFDVANNSGTFNSGNFINAKRGGTTRFKVDFNGIVSTGLGTTASTNAVCSSLANTTAPTAGTAYELRDCNAAPAADYAEVYPVASDVEYGDVVVTGAQMVDTYDITNGAVDWNKVKGQVTQMVKSTTAYQHSIIGVVSDNHGDFTSAGYNLRPEVNAKPIALAGRVPVKVTLENGAIMPGDYVTTSATQPGRAMKALRPGMVIGQAISGYDGSSGSGTVMVFVNPMMYDPTMLVDAQGNVMLQRGASATALVATTMESSAYLVNQKGSGNVLQLQANNSDRLLISNNGTARINASPSDPKDDILILAAGHENVFTISARGEARLAGVIIVKDDTFAGSIATNDQGEADIMFSYDLGTGKPVVQLTAESEAPVFAQVASWIQDDEANYIGFKIKSFGFNGSPVPAIVHYLVVGKQDDYATHSEQELSVVTTAYNDHRLITYSIPGVANTVSTPIPGNGSGNDEPEQNGGTVAGDSTTDDTTTVSGPESNDSGTESDAPASQNEGSEEIN